MKTVLPPYEGPPKIIRNVNPVEDLPYYVETGNSIGYPKTFPEDVWNDENDWYDKNVWGS